MVLFSVYSSTAKTATTLISHIICFRKIKCWLTFLNSELANTVILIDYSITGCIHRHSPTVFITSVKVVYNQFCYPNSFLSIGSYTLPLYKLGVHFLCIFWSQSDTLGKIIFIHFLRSTVLTNLAQFSKLPRYYRNAERTNLPILPNNNL